MPALTPTDVTEQLSTSLASLHYQGSGSTFYRQILPWAAVVDVALMFHFCIFTWEARGVEVIAKAPMFKGSAFKRK